MSRLRTIALCLLVVTFGKANFAWSAPHSISNTIDASEVQRFEQNYEEWVQTLVQSIVPQNPSTVLVELNYTSNPQQLQTYEELKAAEHLPGLPEVSDPNFTRPTESPLFTLVNQQNIKIIFEAALTSNQKRLLDEVLNSKLKIDSSRGDHLVLDQTSGQALESTSSYFSGKNFLFALALLAFGTIVLVSIKRKTAQNTHENTNEAPPELQSKLLAIETMMQKNKIPAEKVREVFESEANLITKIKKNNPKAFSKTSQILNPINIIMKSNPKAIINTVRNENPRLIAEATFHAPDLFISTIIQICTKEQQMVIRNLWKQKFGTVSEEKSRYAQTLLAAKVHRAEKDEVSKSIENFTVALNAKTLLQINLKEELKKIKRSIQNSSKSESKSEANL